jgi:hypothetical protein
MAERDASRVAACECGSLILTVTGAPVHVHACTCTKCQRSSGSAFSLSAWFAECRVAISGAYTTFFYTGAEDPTLMAGFCPRCSGGKFFRTGDYLQGCIGISVGSFADPGFPPPDHIHWWPDRPHWLGLPLGPKVLDGN